MGRPTFTIDQQRLRGLREEAGKTQLEIAKDLHAKLGKKHPSSDATLARDYQRIELSGRTSRQRAKALAEIFNVDVEVLQGKGGPEPIDYLAGIASLLRNRFATGANEALIQALKVSANTQAPSEESISFLAEDIGERIEAAQLGRNPSELKALSDLTGLTESELLKPANVQGYWLVIANGPGIHSTEFVRGASMLVGYVRDIVKDRLDYFGSDGSIHMFRDDPWFRIEILRSASMSDVIRIDFVRCSPCDGTGIRWARASWRERFVFEDSFRDWGYFAANFVTDFEGRQSPTGDIRCLRLLVTEHDGMDYHPTGRMIVSGNLDEINDEMLSRFRRSNSSHTLVLSWLTADLTRSLAPYLSDYPRKCWSMRRGQQVVIDLDESMARNQPIQNCHFGTKYRITLVEEIRENEFVPVPWRNKDMETLEEAIMKKLDDFSNQSWRADEARRAFDRNLAAP